MVAKKPKAESVSTCGAAAAAAVRQLDPTVLGKRSTALAVGLAASVIGQAGATQEVMKAWVKANSGLSNPQRPLVSLLFTGPSGVGKTLTVEVLAELIHGSRKNMLRIDCAEFQLQHEMAKLIGAPPGYLGHRETQPMLTQQKLQMATSEKSHICLVLFDEIEKASDSLWTLLLGILDKATLNLGDNTRVDFSNCMIFLSSNLGSRAIESLLRPSLGFAPATGDGIDGAGRAAVRKHFTAEFRNRLDQVVVFKPLSQADIGRIFDIEIGRLPEPLSVLPSDAARERLIKDGYQPEFGARHLERAIEAHVILPIAHLIDSGQLEPNEPVRIDWNGHRFDYYRV
jgi:ATP-dependent Clp protease ATP-binding subunit ClpA